MFVASNQNHLCIEDNYSPMKLYDVHGRIPRQKVDMLVGIEYLLREQTKRE